jgi:hypothetical protein
VFATLSGPLKEELQYNDKVTILNIISLKGKNSQQHTDI